MCRTKVRGAFLSLIELKIYIAALVRARSLDSTNNPLSLYTVLPFRNGFRNSDARVSTKFLQKEA